MLIKALRALALAATFAMAGCILSTEDISTQVPPTTPILEGSYNNIDVANSFKFTLKGDTYVIDKGECMRFFKLPEFDDYIMQYWKGGPDGQRPDKYAYYQVSIPNNTRFIIREAGTKGDNTDRVDSALLALLPPYLKNLMQADKEGIHVISPKRDTLYILREMGRRDLPLKNTATYQRVP